MQSVDLESVKIGGNNEEMPVTINLLSAPQAQQLNYSSSESQ